MSNIIIFFVVSFVLDYLVSLSVKSLNLLSENCLQIMFLQILNVICGVIFVFCELRFYQFLIMKILVMMLLTLLAADNYSLKNLSLTFFSFLFFTFSIYGASMFLMEFLDAVIFEIFGQNLPFLYRFEVLFLLFLFIFAIFYFSKNIASAKKLKNYLAKVSFSINGKHIKIVGLLDSGNTLYDTKTGNAVVVVSTKVLKQILSDYDYSKISSGDYESLGITNYVDYVAVGGVTAKMPIISKMSVQVSSEGETKVYRCAIGFIDQNFVGGKFQCLLHKDFV